MIYSPPINGNVFMLDITNALQQKKLSLSIVGIHTHSLAYTIVPTQVDGGAT